MTCVHCGGKLERGAAPFHADRSGYHVHWDAVPAWVCAQCGEAMFDTQEVDAIQAGLAALDAHVRELTTTATQAN
jgi:YgiT-type zinc finger domain-containing protein